jgi:C-terminal processing protease CtpA/Prc
MLLTGALHDNHRALVMGDGDTYGKGRIQSVFELQVCDGVHDRSQILLSTMCLDGLQCSPVCR